MFVCHVFGAWNAPYEIECESLVGEMMKHTNKIKMHAALWVMLGMACLVSVPVKAGGRDMGCSPTVANPCTGGSSGGSRGGGYSAPSYDYEAERRRKEAAEAAERERQRREAEAAAERQREFERNRDEAVGRLKGSSGSPGSAMSQLKGLASTDNSGLKGSGFDSGGRSHLKGVSASPGRASPARTPHTDTSVVDARNVPSGLPKALDNAIAKAYSPAPPGVSDRVRKGFQAVMLRDWKVAKAWFQDALNRDPNNAGLKRLVALAGSPQQHALSRVEVDARNEPAGLGGGSPLKGSGATPGKTKTTAASKNQTRIPLQLPNPNDIQVMFPGVKSADDKLALDALFGLNGQSSASKSGKTR